MIGRAGAASVGVASVAAAIAGYAVLVIVARYVTPAVNADFLVFWSVFFAGYAVLGGLQQEATRAVGTAWLDERDQAPVGARVMPWSLLIGGGVALAVAALAPWWFPAILTGQSWATLAVLCLSIVVLAGHVTLGGALAGRRQWTTSAVLVGGESTLRLVLVGVAATLGAGLLGLEVATAASAAFWLVLITVRRVARSATTARSSDGPRRMVSRSLQAMLASAGTAVLVVGFPTILRLSSDVSEWATAAPLVLAISLTRAPLLLPLNAYQGVAIGYFLDPHRRRGPALARIVFTIIGLGLIGAVLAWLFGPWIMAAFFGPDYRVSGVLLGVLTLAAVVLAVLTITGACVLAIGRHRAYALGWIVAAVVSTGLVFLDIPLTERAALALAVGPALGAAMHVAALWSGMARGEATRPA